MIKQVDVFPIKKPGTCVCYYTILNYHWYNITAKINYLNSNHDIMIKSHG